MRTETLFIGLKSSNPKDKNKIEIEIRTWLQTKVTSIQIPDEIVLIKLNSKSDDIIALNTTLRKLPIFVKVPHNVKYIDLEVFSNNRENIFFCSNSLKGCKKLTDTTRLSPVRHYSVHQGCTSIPRLGIGMEILYAIESRLNYRWAALFASNDISMIEIFETLGKIEKKYNRALCLEVEIPDFNLSNLIKYGCNNDRIEDINLFKTWKISGRSMIQFITWLRNNYTGPDKYIPITSETPEINDDFGDGELDRVILPKYSKKIILPEGVTLIKEFYHTGELIEEIVFPKSLVTFVDVDFSIEISKLDFGNTQIKSINLKNWKDVTKVVLPNTLTKLEIRGFQGCINLVNINIPPLITNISDGAFENCLNLKEIKLPEGVTRLGKNAFNNCQSLKSINIPTTLTRVSVGCFRDCICLDKHGCKSEIHTGLEKYVKKLPQYEYHSAENITNLLILESERIIAKLIKKHRKAISLTIEHPELLDNPFSYYKNCNSIREINLKEVEKYLSLIK